MLFDEWWDSKIEIGTPDTFRGWQESCRKAWVEGAKAEREACANMCDEIAEVYGDNSSGRALGIAADRMRSNV